MEEETNVTEREERTEEPQAEEAKPEEKKSGLLKIVIVIIVLLLAGFMFMGGGGDNAEEVMEEEEAAEEVSPGNVPPAPAGGGSEIPSADELTVSYTDAGFSPFLLEVNAGDAVNFVNNTNGTLWVTSKNHPTVPEQNYPEFDSGKSIPQGESYNFTFTKTGSWGYKNLNKEEHLGTIVVAPQNQQ